MNDTEAVRICELLKRIACALEDWNKHNIGEKDGNDETEPSPCSPPSSHKGEESPLETGYRAKLLEVLNNYRLPKKSYKALCLVREKYGFETLTQAIRDAPIGAIAGLLP